jgi:hypothetical protein
MKILPNMFGITSNFLESLCIKSLGA